MQTRSRTVEMLDTSWPRSPCRGRTRQYPGANRPVAGATRALPQKGNHRGAICGSTGPIGVAWSSRPVAPRARVLMRPQGVAGSTLTASRSNAPRSPGWSRSPSSSACAVPVLTSPSALIPLCVTLWVDPALLYSVIRVPDAEDHRHRGRSSRARHKAVVARNRWFESISLQR